MRYDIILFDADGTLLDFHKSESEAVREAMELNGIQPTDEKVSLYSQINDGLWKKLERGEIEKNRLYASRWVMLVEYYGFNADPYAMSSYYTETLATKSYLMDGALEICKYLYGKYHLYVVTNGKKSVQDGRFDPSPLAPMFEGVFVSEEIGFEKPRREYFDAVVKNIPDFNTQEAIIIGDSLTSDMQGGINYGIDTCWFNPARKSAPAEMNLTYVINSLDELKNIL